MAENLPTPTQPIDALPAEQGGGTAVLDRTDSRIGEADLPTPTADEMEAIWGTAERLDGHDDTTDSRPTPPTEFEITDAQKKALKFQLVDVTSGMTAHAFEYGNERIAERETQGRGRWLRNLRRSLIDRGALKDSRRRHFIDQALEEINESGNYLIMRNGSDEDYRAETQAIVTRMGHEANLLREGETNQSLQLSESGRAYVAGMRGALRNYASGHWTLEQFNEARQGLDTEYGDEVHGGRYNLWASNAEQIAATVKSIVDNADGIERIDNTLEAKQARADQVVNEIEFKVGDARVGAVTGANFTRLDRAIEWMSNNRIINKVVSEQVITTAATIAVQATKWATHKAAVAVAFTGAGTILTGAYAGARRHHKVATDEQTMYRQAESGRATSLYGGEKYQQTMETFLAHMEDAGSLLNTLRERMANEDMPPGDRARGLLESISHIAGLQELSDHIGKGLIRSEEFSIDQNRTALMIERAEAEVELRHIIESSSEEDLITSTLPPRAAGESMDDYMQRVVAQAKSAVAVEAQRDVDEHEAALRRYNLRSSGVRFLTGGALSLVEGLGLQEVESLIPGFHMQGIVEGAKPDAERNTELESLKEGVEHLFGDDNTHSVTVGEHMNVNLPQGYNVTEHGNTWDLTGPDGKSIGSVGFDAHGHLTSASAQLLAQHNLAVNVNTHLITPASAETVSRTPAEYMQAHSGDFRNVHFQEYLDDNSRRPIENALRLDRGGVNGSGINANGQVEYSVSSLTENGSWHGSDHEKVVQLMQEGRLRFVVRALDGKGPAEVIQINPNGTMVIPQNDFNNGLFTEVNGKADFHGNYAAAAIYNGTNADGSENYTSIAAITGDHTMGNNTITDTVQQAAVEQVTINVTEVNGGLPTAVASPLLIDGSRGARPGEAPTLVPIRPRPETRPRRTEEEFEFDPSKYPTREPRVYRIVNPTRRSRTALTGPERLVEELEPKRPLALDAAPADRQTSSSREVATQSNIENRADLNQVFQGWDKATRELLSRWNEVREQTNFNDEASVRSFIDRTEATINAILMAQRTTQSINDDTSDTDAVVKSSLNLLTRLGLKGRVRNGQYKVYDARRFINANRV